MSATAVQTHPVVEKEAAGGAVDNEGSADATGIFQFVQEQFVGKAAQGCLDDTGAPHLVTEEELSLLKKKLQMCDSHSDAPDENCAICSAFSFWQSQDGSDFARASLIQKNGSLEGADEVCRAFVTFRSSHSWPLRITSASVSTALPTGMHVLRPAQLRSKMDYPILLYDMANLDLSLCSMEEYQKMGVFLLECLLYGDTPFTDGCPNEPFNANGIIYMIVDARNMGIFDLGNFSFGDIFRGVGMFQDSFPMKLRKIFVLSSSYFLSPLTSALHMVFPSKVQERVVLVDSSLQQLYDEVPTEHLPVSLGGACDMAWSEHVRKCRPEDDTGEMSQLHE